MDIRQQLLAAFEAEHREHLDAIRSALASGAAGRDPDWNDVFRRAHSLKGASRAVDLPAVEEVAHRLESLFETVSAGKRRLDREAHSAIDLALDRIEAYVADMKTGSPTMPADALAALDRCLAAPDAPAPSSAETPAKAASLTEASEPPTVELALPSSQPASEQGHAVLRVPAAIVESLTEASYGLMSALPGEYGIANGIAGLAAAMNALRTRLGTLRSNGIEATPALFSELGSLESGLADLARNAFDLSRQLRTHQAAVEAASGRVRDEAERLALVPAETMFGNFARAIRDMARSEGREVDVSAHGLDLPIDRAILQALSDSVLHALRNAFGHGEESLELRLRAGKPAALSIQLVVEIRGNLLVIAIHDDGRGPDLRAIEAKARERRLLSRRESADDQKLLALVFEPGLSTASSVDTLSGRGIGLSVVAESVRKLQGNVRIEPRIPHGTSLVMSLPLSAARRPVLIVEAGGATYALPGASVERLLITDADCLDTIAGRTVARIGSGATAFTAPVVALSELVGSAAQDSARSGGAAVLLRAGDRRCLLSVDRLHEVHTLLVRPAPPIGTQTELIVGTIVLGNDAPVLVLDAETLIERALIAPPRSVVEGSKGPRPEAGRLPQARRSTILVVDDSITTRTLEKTILEAAGYRVVACVDGQDALDRLRAGIEPVDLVVADVEMPRLDGFGLVKALRSEPTFAKLPVILMTSRGAPEDIARGLELGADAYLTKQRFDQRELLDTVGQLV